jgi:hypothetical protein
MPLSMTGGVMTYNKYKQPPVESLHVIADRLSCDPLSPSFYTIKLRAIVRLSDGQTYQSSTEIGLGYSSDQHAEFAMLDLMIHEFKINLKKYDLVPPEKDE